MTQQLSKAQLKRTMGVLTNIGKYHKGSNPASACQIGAHFNCKGKHMSKYGIKLPCTCDCHKAKL